MTSMLTAHAGNLNRKGDKNERTKTYNSNTTTRDSPEYCDHSTSSEFTRSPYTNGDVSNEAVGDQSKSEGSVEGGLEMKGRMQGVGRAQEEGDAGKGKAGAEEKKASAIRAQMSVLMLGFYEIVRQVEHLLRIRDKNRQVLIPPLIFTPKLSQRIASLFTTQGLV